MTQASQVPTPETLFDGSRPVPSKFKGLPEPPFMVASVIEDLQTFWTHSEAVQRRLGLRRHKSIDRVLPEDDYNLFASVVEVVAGEADSFCARRAHETGATVLTSDSDLLIYDLGEGSVMMFKDIVRITDDESSEPLHEGIRIESGKVEIHGTIYRSSRLRDHFTTQGVQFEKAIFARTLDTYASSKQILARAAEELSEVEKVRFQEFTSDYMLVSSAPAALAEAEPSTLDPRVSELIMQFRKPLYRDVHSIPRMFLPPLVEDHTRACAWSHGIDLRQLAYSFLKSAFDTTVRHTEIAEYSRKGFRIIPTNLRLFNCVDLVAGASAVLEKIRRFKQNMHCPYPLLRWRIFGFYEVCHQRERAGKPALPKDVIQRFLEVGYVNDMLVWDNVHIDAEVQSVLYSVRILKQILLACLCDFTGEIPALAEELAAQLDDSPPIRDLMGSCTGVPPPAPRKETKITESLERMYQLLSGTLPDLQRPFSCSGIAVQQQAPAISCGIQPSETIKGKKKRKASASIVSASKAETLDRRTNNIFEALERD